MWFHIQYNIIILSFDLADLRLSAITVRRDLLTHSPSTASTTAAFKLNKNQDDRHRSLSEASFEMEKTRSGTWVLIDGGNKYYRTNFSKNSSGCYWQCSMYSKHKCRARIVTTLTEFYVSDAIHNHLPVAKMSTSRRTFDPKVCARKLYWR